MQIRMLREIDAMFGDAPQTRKTLEVKEEMLQNLMEKYNDLIAEGKSEEAAFTIALSSVGDISDLLAELGQPAPKAASFPEPDLSDYEEYVQPEAAPHPQMEKHQKAATVSMAVMLYILSPLALIFLGEKLGLALFFIMIAAATGMLIYYGMTRERPRRSIPGEPVLDEEEEARNMQAYSAGDDTPPQRMSKEQRKFFSSISSALWLITVALYFIISFASHAWHLTWIIFLVAAAVNNIIKAFLDLYRSR